jgi:hypothetical protein
LWPVLALGFPASASAIPPRPIGEDVLRCPASRDAGLSSVSGEQRGNTGGNPRLKLKGQQESILLDIDVKRLRGRVVQKALLHLRSASPDWPLARVGVSTVASPWEEGTAEGYRPQRGSACFSQAALEEREWGPPGGNLMDAVFGLGNTVWRFADATPPDRTGWQTVAVAPKVVAARVAGISRGFLLWDEVGNEWSCRNGDFRYFHFPNRFVYSRESLKSGPWMEIRLGPEDREPPEAVRDVRVEKSGLPKGEARFHWKTPPDQGAAGTIGFHVRVLKPDGREVDVPRYQIPMAKEPGGAVALRLRGVDLSPDARHRLHLRPVDGAGNVGDAATVAFSVSPGPPPISIPNQIPEVRGPSEFLRVSDRLRVRVIDALDKIDPVSGERVPRPSRNGATGSHLFSAGEGRIRLHAARNETVAFQLHLAGRSDDLKISLAMGSTPNFPTALHQFAYVSAGGRRLPDPLIPVDGAVSAPSPDAGVPAGEAGHHGLIAEIHVPHGTPPGRHSGRLRIETRRGKVLALSMDLRVWDFALPDRLSFVPEMNAYGTVSPYRGYAHYRLAHRHRTCLNRLPAGWNGRPAFAPKWNGKKFEWAEWDRNLRPLLDGTAFSDLPRSGQPVDALYLPFSENWPVPLYPHYRPSYWAESALDDAYRAELGRAFAAFARHCDERGWHRTRFQFYLNNKVYYRERYAESSAPWIFDEPVNTQDFWALRWYGRRFRRAVDPVRGGARMRFRADISHFQFGRNILWGFLDETYVGGNDPQKTRMWRAMNRRWPGAALYEYGTANPIAASNAQPALWCLSAWAAGADGVLPWQTIGSEESWKTADQTALFYPGPEGPLASIRLKAFRRGQQDVEYLVALAQALGRDRSEIAAWLRRRLNISGTVRKAHAGDAGTRVFRAVSHRDLWRLRTRIGAFLSDSSPAPPGAPRGFRLRPGPPPPSLGRASSEASPPTRTPDCGDFTP